MKKIILLAGIILSLDASAQSGALTVNNYSDCDVTIGMTGQDASYGTNCDFIGFSFTVPAGGTTSYSSYCMYETALSGWLSSPGPANCPLPASPTFIWMEARVFYSGCTGPCPAPMGSKFVAEPLRKGCKGFSDTWTDGCHSIQWLQSGIASYDVTLNVN